MIRFDAAALSAAVKTAMAAAGDNTGADAKRAVLLRVEGQSLSVYAVGSTADYVASVPVTLEGDGMSRWDCLPGGWVELNGQYLAAELDVLEESASMRTISLERVKLGAGTCEYVLPVAEPKLTPPEQTEAGSVHLTIQAEGLRRALTVGEACAGGNFPMVCLELCRYTDGWTLSALSTDGVCMSCGSVQVAVSGGDEARPETRGPGPESVSSITAPPREAWSFCLSEPAARLMGRLTEGQAEVKISTSLDRPCRSLVMYSGGSRATIRPVDGDFPDYRQLLPNLSFPHGVKLNAQELRKTVAGAAAAVDATVVVLSTSGGEMHVTAASSAGGTKTGPADARMLLSRGLMDGAAPAQIGVSPKKLAAILSACGRTEMELRYGASGADPVAVLVESGWAVLMPVRLD